MPLTGGPTDKAGNSYERRWTVFSLLDLLEGAAQSVRIEVPGAEGVAAEFRVMAGGIPSWHQAKRQHDGGPWTIANMANEGVLGPWWPKIQASGRCVFVSSTGAQELRELQERASSAIVWAEFATEFLTDHQQTRFKRLRSAWGDPPEEAVYQALRSIDVWLLGERELSGYLEARLASLATGTPSTAAAVLAQLVDDSCHQELTAEGVWKCLAANGITARNLSLDATLVQRLAEMTQLYLRRTRRLHIGGRKIKRQQATDAFERLSERQRVLVAGAAGSGKSVVAAEVTDLARHAGWTILVLTMDRLPDAGTAHSLGTALGLPDSPTTVLAGVAGGGDALLVLDQVDAISVTSGRHPERLSLVEDLLGQAASHPRLRILLACRQFDLDNDRELRSVAADEDTAVVSIGPLDRSVVNGVLAEAGLMTELPSELAELLTIPLNLAIYVELAKAGVSNLSGGRSLTGLYEEYWTKKREACRVARSSSDEWLAVIDRLVEYMSNHQTLAVPSAVLDDLDMQVSVMASEGVLTSDNGSVTFFHETFFDYCFARRFVSAGENLRELLLAQEQDLFRRAQVRQLLTYERAMAFPTYLTDLGWLLTAADVRIHIKALVVALVQTIADPQPQEWALLRPIAMNPESPLHGRLWQALRANQAWFPVLDESGDWSAWLNSREDAIKDTALWALTGMTSRFADEAAELLHAMPTDEAWPSRLRRFMRAADIHAGRPLFDLFLKAVADGYYDGDSAHGLWDTMRGLGALRPEWATEVVSLLLHRALATGTDNPFTLSGPLAGAPHALSDQTVRGLAWGAPAAFAEGILPHILEIVRRNARPEWGGGDVLLDALWGGMLRIYRSQAGLKDDLYAAMDDALRALAKLDPAYAKRMFDRLRADRHESAWFLLARGYAANPHQFADEAVAWLAKTPGALHLGYTDAPHWVSRELIAAVTPRCGETELNQLLAVLIGYTSPFERTYEARHQRGYGELCLLNAVDSARLSDDARSRRAELRRKFLRDDAEPPVGWSGGVAAPPIPEDRARKMTDRQWLRAMARHGASGARLRRDGKLVGDASVQAQVLETIASEAPQRFARLLLRFPNDVAQPYVDAILRGLTGRGLEPSLLLAVCQRARQAGSSDTNRWILRLIESEAAATSPDEVLDIIIDIAADDSDPVTNGDGSDPDIAGLTSSRAAAALSFGTLIGEHSDRLPRFVSTLELVARDPATSVRAMAIGALATVLYVDAPLALRLFLVSVEEAGDELFGSRYVELFLNHAIRLGHYAAVASVLGQMSRSDVEDVRRSGARQLTVASYRDPGLDALVDTALEGDETTRASVVEVFADNLIASERRDRAFNILIRGFDDSSPVVRSRSVRCFYNLEKQNLKDYRPLIGAFAKSRSLNDHADTVLQVLESVRQPLPIEVLDLCERFAAVHGGSFGDISNLAAGTGIYIVQLAVRMHAQHSDQETRRRSLDLIDQLVASGAPGIDVNLAQIER